MNEIRYEVLTDKNMKTTSLDHFIRHQEVKECWRKVDGEWKLLPIEFVEDWDVEKCRSVAEDILEAAKENAVVYGAFDEDEMIGYIQFGYETFGSQNQYTELSVFHVSEPYRRKGIGRQLFLLAAKELRERGAERMYISAHSSKESQAFYRSMGCVDATEVNQKLAQEEPFDVQMEYVL